jgi:hypothetical protein
MPDMDWDMWLSKDSLRCRERMPSAREIQREARRENVRRILRECATRTDYENWEFQQGYRCAVCPEWLDEQCDIFCLFCDKWFNNQCGKCYKKRDEGNASWCKKCKIHTAPRYLVFTRKKFRHFIDYNEFCAKYMFD